MVEDVHRYRVAILLFLSLGYIAPTKLSDDCSIKCHNVDDNQERKCIMLFCSKYDFVRRRVPAPDSDNLQKYAEQNEIARPKRLQCQD